MPEEAVQDQASPEQSSVQGGSFLAPDWETVAPHFAQSFPGLDPAMMRRRYEQARQMQNARRYYGTQEGTQEVGTPEQYIARRALPIVSMGANLASSQRYTDARDRVQSGNANPADYFTVAGFERQQQIDQQRESTTGGAIAGDLLRLPALAGEMYMGGQALSGLGIGSGVAGGSLAGNVARWAGRTAVQTAAAPAMWAPEWTQRNLEEGRQALDVRGLPAALTMGFLNTAVLGSLGRYGNSITGSGVLPVARRLIARTATGIAEQQGVDALASAVSHALPRAYRLETGYGVLGSMIRGDDWGRQLLTQAATFAAFSALHEGQHGAPVLDHVRDRLNEMHDQGVPRTEAMRTLATEMHQAQIEHQQPQVPEPGIDRPVPSPHAERLRSVFGDFEHSTNPDYPGSIERQIAGRSVFLTPEPARGAMRVDFELPRGQVQGPSRERVQQGTFSLARELADVAGRARHAGLNITFETNARRARAYEEGLRRAGFERSAEEATPGQPNKRRYTYQPAERAETTPPEPVAPQAPSVPQTPLERLSAEQRSQLARSIGLTAKGLEAKANEPWVAQLVERVLAPGTPTAAQEPRSPEATQAPIERPVPQPAAEPAPAAPAQAEQPRSLAETPGWDKLTPREQHIIEQRLLGRAHEAIGADPEVLRGQGRVKPYTRERIRQVEAKALEKLGSEHSITQAVHRRQRAEGIAERLAAGEMVDPSELHADPEAARTAVQDAMTREDRAADAAVDDLIKELESGSLTPERRAEVEGLARASLASFEEAGQPRRGAARPAGTGEQAPVRREQLGGVPEAAALPRPAAPGEGGPGPAQGHPEAPPAPASGGPAGGHELIPEATRAAIGQYIARGDEHAIGYWREILKKEFHFDPAHVEAIIRQARAEAGHVTAPVRTRGMPGTQSTPYARQEYVDMLRNDIRGQIMHDLAPQEMRDVQEAARLSGIGNEKVQADLRALGEHLARENREPEEAQASEAPSAAQVTREERGPTSVVRPDTGDLGIESIPFKHGFGDPVTEAERRALPGGGEPGPGGERPRGLTALANERTDAEREARGDSPILRQARRANPTVWDAAMARLDADPQASAKLAEELARQSRATTVEENALLLHQRVALSNEQTRAYLDAIRAATESREARRAGRNNAEQETRWREAETRVDALREQINALDRVIVDTGSEWGRAGQFRRQLVAEDYSLSGMMRKAEAAAKRPLSPAEREQILTLQKRIEDLEGKLSKAEDALRQAPESEEAVTGWFGARVRSRDAQQEFQRQITRHRWQAMSRPQQIMDWLRRARIAEVISSPITAAKIGASSIEQMAAAPVRELIGSALRLLPGMRQIAEHAPIEGRGFNPATEAAAARSGLTEGLRDGWHTMRNGRSELDIAFGKQNDQPRTWIDWIGQLHAAEKAPAVRAAYERAYRNIEASERGAGRDVTSPAARESIGQRAYAEGSRAKFQEDNAIVTLVNRIINDAKRSESVVARSLGHAADLLLPVRRTPTNIVFQAFDGIFGLPLGTIRTAYHNARGTAELPPAVADSIFRQLKRGSIGLPLLALGYYLGPKLLGGQYSGRRRDEELQPGQIRIGDHTVPAWVTAHHPAFMALHVGATIRRYEQPSARQPGQGRFEATVHGLGGLLEEVPMIREQREVGELVGHHNERAVGNLARSFAIPQLIQWTAQRMDVDPRTGNALTGQPVHRVPHGLGESLEMGVPGMRQRVPVARR